MKTKRKIDGRIRVIETNLDSKRFYDFEFWGNVDINSQNLVCFCRLTDPKILILVEIGSLEGSFLDGENRIDTLMKAVANRTGFDDLTDLDIKRFIEIKNDSGTNFQDYLANYKDPIPVYRSIFRKDEEAIQIDDISIEEFKGIGGSIQIVGDIEISSMK